MLYTSVKNDIEDRCYENWLALLLCIKEDISIEKALNIGCITARSENKKEKYRKKRKENL